MRKALKALGGLGVLLLLLNEIRGAAVVAGVLASWSRAEAEPAQSSAAAVLSGLKCAALLLC